MGNQSTPENPAETMRDVISELGKHGEINNPAADLTKAHLVTIPDKRTVVDLSEYHRKAAEYLKPARRIGTAHLSDMESLINWANRFKSNETVLYANPDMENPSLTCIADYHKAGPADPTNPTGDPAARHCKHRAVYDFPLSDEWKAWMNVSGRSLEMDDLGEFIEANAKDIMDPTPAIIKGSESNKNQPWENRLIQTAQQIGGRYGQLARLLAMSKRFLVHETSDLKAVSNRDSGEQQVQFINEHKDAEGKPLNIPNLIIIAIPVFRGGAPYRMSVRFRYRKSGGNVRFVLTIYNPEKSFQASFDETIETAMTEVGLPLFMGKPES